jgi:hypothetical protein
MPFANEKSLGRVSRRDGKGIYKEKQRISAFSQDAILLKKEKKFEPPLFQIPQGFSLDA